MTVKAVPSQTDVGRVTFSQLLTAWRISVCIGAGLYRDSSLTTVPSCGSLFCGGCVLCDSGFNNQIHPCYGSLQSLGWNCASYLTGQVSFHVEMFYVLCHNDITIMHSGC